MEESKLARLALAEEEEWTEPAPLISENVYGQEYPLSSLSPTIRCAVEEFLEFTPVPEALAGSVAMAAAALSCQHTADVVIDSQNQYPINLFLLIQQNNGERKSSVSRYFLKPLLEWEREQNKRALDTEQEFIQLRLIYEDSTHESLIVDLAAGRKSAALWSDEAALILGGTSMRENAAMGYLAVLNKAFHGDKIVHRRKQAESAELDGYRLSSCLMMQQKILTHLLNLGAKSGVGLAEGTGFLTRFLFAAPKSIIGTRKYQQAPKTLPYMDEFKRRMQHHLNKPVPQDWNSIRTK